MQSEPSEDYKRECDDWRRVRSAIEHENQLVNNRVTWLILTQAALFAAFAGLFSKWAEARAPEPSLGLALGALPLMAICLCVNIWVNISNAEKALGRLTRWWYREAYDQLDSGEITEEAVKGACDKVRTIEERHPPLQLWGDLHLQVHNLGHRRFALPFRVVFMPVYFITGWVVLFAGLVIPKGSYSSLGVAVPSIPSALSGGGLLFVVLVCLGLGFALGSWRASKKDEKEQTKEVRKIVEELKRQQRASRR
jgi:hypothetical protein